MERAVGAWARRLAQKVRPQNNSQMEIDMNTIDFINFDIERTFFPLESNLTYIQKGESEINDYIYNQSFDKNNSIGFNQAPSILVPKNRLHVRKALVLDPIANYYLYDVARRLSSFIKRSRDNKSESYGYVFDGNTPTDSFDEYHIFRKRKYELKGEFKFYAKIDIADCFNSFYHHDISNYIRRLSGQVEDYEQFGKFLREINGGVSVNCFPQGYYPAKMIGNAFLSMIESRAGLKSGFILRFLDDTFLFSNSIKDLEHDVQIIQEAIAEHHMFLNDAKTAFGGTGDDFDAHRIDEIKKRLLQKRERATISDDGDDDDELVVLELDERKYLEELIKDPNVSEEDVELALTLARSDFEEVGHLLELCFERHHHLMKGVYRLINRLEVQGDGSSLDETLVFIEEMTMEKLASSEHSEFSLFWMSKILVDYFGISRDLADALHNALNNTKRGELLESYILGLEFNDYGFAELKKKALRDRGDSFVSINAMHGLRNLPSSERNYAYGYAKKNGPRLQLLIKILTQG